MKSFPPGQLLDERVAQHVFGFKRVEVGTHPFSGNPITEMRGPTGKRRARIPLYSTDLRDAQEVLRFMCSKGWDIHINTTDPKYGEIYWRVQFRNNIDVLDGIATTLPHAICLAATEDLPPYKPRVDVSPELVIKGSPTKIVRTRFHLAGQHPPLPFPEDQE